MASPAAPSTALPADEPGGPLSVRGLSVALPDGRILLDGIDLQIAPGEVVVLLGGSGAGKSTFARVLFEPAELLRAGYQVSSAELRFDRQQLGLVPQRGALFDHLDVRGNLELAQRRSRAAGSGGDGGDAAAWLERVGLDPALAAPGTGVGRLSGGQAQRVAVARVLASRRRLLFLDEPSVGLDPQRVRMLAKLLREQVRALGISAIVVTHDVALAGGVADRLFLLSLRDRKLEQLFEGRWPGPLEELGGGEGERGSGSETGQGQGQRGGQGQGRGQGQRGGQGQGRGQGQRGGQGQGQGGSGEEEEVGSEESANADERAASEAERGRWLFELEAALVDHLDRHGEAAPRQGPKPAPSLLRALAHRSEPLVAPFRVAGQALRDLPAQLVRHPGDLATVAARALRQTLLRPLLFYAIVSTLIGYTVLLVVSKVGGAGVRPDALLRQIGGSYVVALAPALSALLFVAASGSATNAWLGSMSLTKQTLALDALGVDHRGYLLAPAWLSVALAYLAVAALFALGMLAGGLLVCRSFGVDHAWQLLTGDLVDPRPERAVYTWRAAFLVWMYAWGIASDVVAKGSAPKPEADAVTRAMTASVVACTLWVVGWELVTVLVVLQ